MMLAYLVEVHQGGGTKQILHKQKAGGDLSATVLVTYRMVSQTLGRNAGTNRTMQMWHVGHDLERLGSRARALGKRYFGPTAACGSVLARRGTLKECALRKVPLAGARVKDGRAGATHVVSRPPAPTAPVLAAPTLKTAENSLSQGPEVAPASSSLSPEGQRNFPCSTAKMTAKATGPSVWTQASRIYLWGALSLLFTCP
eukprot:COSAG06_NODE_3667_length_5042_cov_2.098321_6_plen_200_part_00